MRIHGSHSDVRGASGFVVRIQCHVQDSCLADVFSSAWLPQDVTQAAPSGGAMLDTTKNYTAPSIQSALITIVLKGSSSIFSRNSASNFYLDVEQLSVIHFLDAARFNTVVGLIRRNEAYTIFLNPATGRPALDFTQVQVAPSETACHCLDFTQAQVAPSDTSCHCLTL